MPVKIKAQKDYLLTEVSMELPADLSALDTIMKSTKATGKIVVVYNQGGVMGVNVEQRTKVPESVESKARELLGVKSTEI
jgi:hypothetical protein